MFTLPTLPFATNALEPIIDQLTIEIHHGKHHATYINNLNGLMDKLPQEFQNISLEDLLLSLDKTPEASRQAVLNNAGQVYNHNIYWESITAPSNSGNPSEELSKALLSQWTMDSFKEEWTSAGLTQFGSGWVWLSVDSDKKLVISKTANADSPLLHGLKPILTMDVWEHAYYLNYQNKRAEYINKFFEIINWSEVSLKYSEAIK
jgi:superoxide dismutase, Fe-Mn family